MNRAMATFGLLWTVPLSLLSFAFFRFIRSRIRKAAAKFVQKKMERNEQVEWIALSEFLAQPMALPYQMVSGPRWNCHAVIGVVGPLDVKSKVSIKVDQAQKSAKQWTIVFYEPSLATRTFISSAEVSGSESWQDISLEPGRYSLALRYYNSGDKVSFPAIKVDGENKVDERCVDQEYENYQSFLKKIQNSNKFFYRALHYYVYNLVYWEKWLSKSFVKNEFLPVGNPETIFHYGALQRGQKIQVHFDSKLLEEAHIYIAYDNLASFPVFWEEITSSGYESVAVPCKGYYLIRMHYKSQNRKASPDIETKVLAN